MNIVIQSVAAIYNINNNDANKQKQKMREHNTGENKKRNKTVHTNTRGMLELPVRRYTESVCTAASEGLQCTWHRRMGRQRALEGGLGLGKNIFIFHHIRSNINISL